MTDYEIVLISGGLGIAGTLLGVILTYRLSMKVADQQFAHLRQISKLDSWHVASSAFVGSLAEELAVLESDEDLPNGLVEYLSSAYVEKHKAATAKFVHFVEEPLRTSFKEAWQRHCYGDDSTGKPMRPDFGIEHIKLLFLHYGDEYNRSPGSHPRQLAAQQLRKLISLASKET